MEEKFFFYFFPLFLLPIPPIIDIIQLGCSQATANRVTVRLQSTRLRSSDGRPGRSQVIISWVAVRLHQPTGLPPIYD